MQIKETRDYGIMELILNKKLCNRVNSTPMTLTQICTKGGFTLAGLRNWMKCGRKPRRDCLVRLCQVLECEPEDIGFESPIYEVL